VRKYSDVHTCPLFTNVFLWQQAGGAIVMDADATSALHKKGVSATDDSFKFICFEVSACIFVSCVFELDSVYNLYKASCKTV
jgi:hypothetical protein